VEQIKEATAGTGVDVALELIGSAKTLRQAVLSCSIWAISDTPLLSD
jgi:threonine dehydrogenase-like Zn-dependent dehydrogenase